MFLINSNNVYNTLTKKIYNSSSSIPSMFIGYEIFIYSGLKWLSRVITKWSVGLKFGSLSWNRKRALFKSKQLKKK
jgi:ribosomal protein S19